MRDQLSQLRRDLPWERVEKPYVFEGPSGKETLPELFDGRSQLIVYPFMFAPDWRQDARTAPIGPTAYARGIDMLNVDYQYLDLVPKGQDEDGRGPYWVRRHDEYPR